MQRAEDIFRLLEFLDSPIALPGPPLSRMIRCIYVPHMCYWGKMSTLRCMRTVSRRLESVTIHVHINADAQTRAYRATVDPSSAVGPEASLFPPFFVLPRTLPGSLLPLTSIACRDIQVWCVQDLVHLLDNLSQVEFVHLTKVRFLDSSFVRQGPRRRASKPITVTTRACDDRSMEAQFSLTSCIVASQLAVDAGFGDPWPVMVSLYPQATRNGGSVWLCGGMSVSVVLPCR